jgi:hypothetical protein
MVLRLVRRDTAHPAGSRIALEARKAACAGLSRPKLESAGYDEQFDRISININPNMCHGQACVKGTRMPVHQVVRMLEDGDNG